MAQRNGRQAYLADRDRILARNRQWNQAHKAQLSEYERRYRAENKTAIANRVRQKKYGVSPERFAAMWAEQDGRCANRQCRTVLADGRGVNIDHDHHCCPGKKSCGLCVRGLLCLGCNAVLGYVDDDAERLRGLADYVEAHPLRAKPTDQATLF